MKLACQEEIFMISKPRTGHAYLKKLWIESFAAIYGQIKKINWPQGYNFRRVMGLKLDWASEGQEVSQVTILVDHSCLNFVGLVPQRGF